MLRLNSYSLSFLCTNWKTLFNVLAFGHLNYRTFTLSVSVSVSWEAFIWTEDVDSNDGKRKEK